MLLTGDLIPRVCLAINRQTRKLPERVAGTEHEIPKPSRKLIEDEPPSGVSAKEDKNESFGLPSFTIPVDWRLAPLSSDDSAKNHLQESCFRDIPYSLCHAHHLPMFVSVFHTWRINIVFPIPPTENRSHSILNIQLQSSRL